MMKNFMLAIALVLTLICSPACAQKKADASTSTTKSSAATTKAPFTSSKEPRTKNDGSVASVAKDATESKKAKQTQTSGKTKKADEPAEPTKASSQKSRKKSDGDAAKAINKPADVSELTADQEKKMKSLMRQTLKPFTSAELTPEQRQQADTAFAKPIKDYVLKRSQAGITDELEKSHAAALKSAKASGKSTRDQAKDAFELAGFNEEQVKVSKATQTSLNKAKRNFGKALTAEQIVALPEELQALISSSK